MIVVLDANILIRAVLGTRVPFLLQTYSNRVDFCVSVIAFEEAREELPFIVKSRRVPAEKPLPTVDAVADFVRLIETDSFTRCEEVARRRMARRDPDDWHVLAVALALKAPIWTEDSDFFGCGVATWTTDRVEELLAAPNTDPASSTEE